MKILDIGAGTGIYSHHYARQGYEVDAVELIEHNIEKFRAKHAARRGRDDCGRQMPPPASTL